MIRNVLACWGAVGSIVFACSLAWGQAPPPSGMEPPPAPEAPPPSIAPAEPAPPAAAPAPAPAPPASASPSTPPAGSPPPSTPAGDAATADARSSWQFSTDGTSEAEAEADVVGLESSGGDARWWSLQAQNALNAGTGLMHVYSADSGGAGTFRVSLLGSLYSGSGFLCNSESPCPVPPGSSPATEDSVERIGTHIGISATPLPFLEAFLGFHNSATSNDRGSPQLLQVLGDTNLGVKAFMPHEYEQMFVFGGQLEAWLLNGTGGVGLDGGGTSFAIRALGTADLNNRKNPEERTPLRFHLNLGYLFDNSGAVVSDVEELEPPLGRGERISRIERFGLNINRVDSFEIGLAAEYVHQIVRPFLEWSIDIPLNRQSYVCNIDAATDAGDLCLGEAAGFSTTPSRFTLGLRLYPWTDHGLAFTAAADIGTGATSSFLEELAPEPPYNLYLGVAYAIDTAPPEPVVKKVIVDRAAPAPASIERYFRGRVVDASSGLPIGGAILTFEGRPITGMVAAADGTFRSISLDPGSYTLNVEAAGYRKAPCTGTIPAGTPGVPPPAGGSGFGQPPASAAAVPPGSPGPVVTPLECKLEALPAVGAVNGSLFDAETNSPIGGAKVKITDRLGRELPLEADAAGRFRFENVPPGQAKILVEAPGYMTSALTLEVEANEEVPATIVLHRPPAEPNVVVTPREVKLNKQVHFQHNSADILPDSMALIEEIADVLRSHPELVTVEIQGHTDNTGEPGYNQRLSQERAEAVRQALIDVGVQADRMVPKGYGQDRPLVPNVSDLNRAKNRRVQLIILGR